MLSPPIAENLARNATSLQRFSFSRVPLSSAAQAGEQRRRKTRRLSHRQLHVRDRDREQLSRRSTTARPASTRWRCAAITSAGARISTASRRSGSIISATGRRSTRPILAPNKYRLGIHRPDLRRAEETRHHADRRPVPLRSARLDRQFPEPRFPAAVRRLCRRVRRALSVGPALHADQRDVHLRGLLREIRLVERAEEGRQDASSRRSSTSSKRMSWG